MSAKRLMEDDDAGGRVLHRSIGEAAWHELRRQLGYKLAEHGGRLVTVEAAFIAAQCSACGARSEAPGAHESAPRTWTCEACGARHRRELNAAMNVERRAAPDPIAVGSSTTTTWAASDSSASGQRSHRVGRPAAEPRERLLSR